MPRKWTDEQKQEQAKKIRTWHPWTKSTGVKTPEGKAISSRNAFKGGIERKRAINKIRYNTNLIANQVPQEMIEAAMLECKVKKLIKELKK